VGNERRYDPNQHIARRGAEHIDAVLLDGRGHRRTETLAALHRRDALICEMAASLAVRPPTAKAPQRSLTRAVVGLAAPPAITAKPRSALTAN